MIQLRSLLLPAFAIGFGFFITTSPAHAQKLEDADVGPAMVNSLLGSNHGPTHKGIVVRVGKDGDAAMCFDTELMRMSVGWVKASEESVTPPKADDPKKQIPTPASEFYGLLDPRGSTSFTASHGGPPQPRGGDKQVRFTTHPGPGWEKDGSFKDPRRQQNAGNKSILGNLPADWAKYKGLYKNGDQVVISYTVGNTGVLELPGLIGTPPNCAFTRTLRVEPNNAEMKLAVAWGKYVKPAFVGVTGGVKLSVDGDSHFVTVPPHKEAITFRIELAAGDINDEAKLNDLKSKSGDIVEPLQLTKGGAPKWEKVLETKGVVGKGDGAYVVDSITPPHDNPWKVLLRFGGVDFFADGKRAALSTIGGDVWIVSGLDEKLEDLKWRRFATGLFQPLGLKIVDDVIYTVGRDQITRLHDLNHDGEADFYENFNNDSFVTDNYHEFCLDLQTDTDGNFYYMKGSPWPPNVQSEHQGTAIRVSKDGSKFEIIATGLRAPNGSGMGPGNQLTFSDNEGHWIPSSKVSLVKPGKFYGMVPAAHVPEQPKEFTQPIVWLPKSIDNSSGGQVWVTSDKWGPLKDHMLHMSYGRSTLFALLTETVDGEMQGAVVPFPLKFDSSAMRARFNKGDGQLYLTGLKGWQTNAGQEGALHRVRYTGKPVTMPISYSAASNGIVLGFAVPLDDKEAADTQNWSVEQWNYKWTQNYGSPEFSANDPSKTAHNQVAIKSIKVSSDKKSVLLEIDGVKPVNQMKIRCDISTESGDPVTWDIYGTINKVGPAKQF